MAGRDKESQVIRSAAMRYLKSGESSELDSFTLEALKKADYQLGNRDVGAGYRKAINDRIDELSRNDIIQSESTNVGLLKRRLENNKILAPIILFGAIIIGIGSFTDAINKIKDFISEKEAARETPAMDQKTVSNGVQIQGSGNNFFITTLSDQQLSNSESTKKSLQKMNKEIAFRISVFPSRIKKSRSYKNETAKSNILSALYSMPAANYLKPLFPEYANKSILSICFNLNTIAEDSQKEIIDKGCNLFEEMNRLSINEYYVHDMYKMSIDKLQSIEDEVEAYYKNIIQTQPEWNY